MGGWDIGTNTGTEKLAHCDIGEVPDIVSGGYFATHSALGVYVVGSVPGLPVQGGVRVYANITASASRLN